MCHLADGRVPSQQETQHVLIWDAIPHDARTLLESEATVEGGVSDEHASANSTGTQRSNACLDQCTPDPLAMVLRTDRHRAEQESAL